MIWHTQQKSKVKVVKGRKEVKEVKAAERQGK
jgi:hypothetical protein